MYQLIKNLYQKLFIDKVVITAKRNQALKLNLVTTSKVLQTCYGKHQGFRREKDGNRHKFIGSNLVIFCYKEYEKFALCKSVSQLEVMFIVYSEPIESGHVKHIQNVNTDRTETCKTN